MLSLEAENWIDVEVTPLSCQVDKSRLQTNEKVKTL